MPLGHQQYGPQTRNLSAITMGEVVGRVEALGAQVAPGAGPAHHPIGALIQARAVLGRRQAAVGLSTRSHWLAPASSSQHQIKAVVDGVIDQIRGQSKTRLQRCSLQLAGTLKTPEGVGHFGEHQLRC
jgi:hypothetical protein